MTTTEERTMTKDWGANILGYVDGLGCVRCAVCAEAADEEWGRIIWRDAVPDNAKDCDMCGRPLADPSRTRR